jgi:serine/threonine protein kinase
MGRSRKFASLLWQMLAWDPQVRVSTGEALNHPCWKDVPDPQQDEDQTCARQETLSTDTSNMRKRKSHSTQTAVQRPSPPADGPSNCPPLPATCTDNPTFLTIWKTYHISSQETVRGGEREGELDADLTSFFSQRKIWPATSTNHLTRYSDPENDSQSSLNTKVHRPIQNGQVYTSIAKISLASRGRPLS